MTDEFGEAVREARESRGWSQEFLAAKVGATQSTIDRIESGQTRRSRILPDIAAVLDLQLPGLQRAPEKQKSVGGLIKTTFVLPSELLDRIQEYKIDVGVSSDDEAVRRLIDDALKHRDNFYTITDRLINKLKSLKSLREAAGYVLANHPLVRSISFENEGVRFTLNDHHQVEVSPRGIATVYNEFNSIVKFAGNAIPDWLSPDNVSQGSADEDIPF